MALGARSKLVLVGLGLAGLIAVFLGLQYFWYHGFALGTKTGTIRKLAVTGPPYCKVLLGEIALVGAAPGTPAEIWTFTVDDDADANPLMKSLHDAERAAKPVTLRYRQDKKMWWRCAPTEYYVTGVEP